MKLQRLLPIVTAAALAAAPLAAAPTYAVDPAHSDVSFRIRHMMSKVRGTFREFSGTIVRDDQDLSKASVVFRIQAATIDTRNANRDEDLRSEDFFDVAKFPEIVFESTAVERVSDDEYRVTGRFTMHGVTKLLSLPVRFDGEMKDARGRSRVGYSLSTTLDRKEFGITWNQALDGGGFLLSDEVEVEITIEAKQQ
jgi:polyisoprenoid-binding protein YceI